MKQNYGKWYLLLLLLACESVHAENVHYGNYALPGPGKVAPDLVIIGGNLSLKDTFTVEGDLKIVGGNIVVASDDVTTSTVDLYVLGDLIISNTGVVGNVDASIFIPTGHLVVTGEIVTRSDTGKAFVNSWYGIEAGKIDTFGGLDSSVTASVGSIIVEGDIATKCYVGNASVRAGQFTGPYDVRAASITTWSNAGDTSFADVYADRSVNVRGAIVTRGSASANVSAANISAGGIAAGSILTNALGAAYITSGNYNVDPIVPGYIDVQGDIVTTGTLLFGHLYATDYIKAENISTSGKYDARVESAFSDIIVRGDIAAYSDLDFAYVKAPNIIAKSITTNGYEDSYVYGFNTIMVEREIVTESRNGGPSFVRALSGRLLAGNITTKSAGGDASVSAVSASLDVGGTIFTKTESAGDAHVSASGPSLNAGSIFSQSDSGDAYVKNVFGTITVKDDIRTRNNSGNASVESLSDLTARSILAIGGNAYVLSNLGSINVIEDIVTNASVDDGYVKAPNGNVVAQKIETSAPAGKDMSIQSAAGSGQFSFIPVDGATIIKDAEFSFDSDYDWNTQMTIAGTCTINGNGHLLTFGATGSITVAAGATLVLRNIEVHNVTGQVISCSDGTGTLKLQDVDWVQSADCQFNQGLLDIYGDVVVSGPGKVFTYTSGQPLTIHENSRLAFVTRTTLRYNSSSTSMIVMADESSKLNFDGSTLNVNQSLRFTRGTIALDNYVVFNVAQTKTLFFGNGSLSGNIKFAHHVASRLDRTGLGFVVNANV